MAAYHFREERLRMIMDMIYAQKKVIVNDLAAKFKRSPSSIRLDLDELEARGLISRTHGGAILAENIGNNFITDVNIIATRESTYAEEKQMIGKAVVNIIHDGDSIMIDGGSTTAYVARNLHRKRGLTIITCSYHLLPTLLEIPDAKIYLTGGLIHRDFQDQIGEITIDSIKRFKPDCVIMGIDGISDKHGFTTTEPAMAQIKRQMLSVCSKAMVVADSSKFDKVCLMRMSELEDVQYVVTDSNAPKKYVDLFRDLNVNLIQS